MSRRATWVPGLIVFVLSFSSSIFGQDPPPEWLQQVSKDIELQEYHFTSALDASTFTAPNRLQGIRSELSPEGLQITPRETEEWQIQLRVSGFGRPGQITPVGDASPQAGANRVGSEYGPLSEWYVNSTEGLKQNFELREAPDGVGAAPLVIEMALTGASDVRVSGDGQSICFVENGVTVLHYRGLIVTDANGTPLTSHLEGSAGRVAIVIDDAAATYPVLVDPLFSAVAWSAESDQSGSSFGYSVATAGDVNGDGFSDIIVGARKYDAGQTEEGRAFLYFGSAAGPSLTADWTAESNVAGARFGQVVTTAGDVNNDGFDDILVTGHFYTNGQTKEGAAWLYLGGPAGPSATPDWTYESNQGNARFGSSAAAAGDVNGDGFADIIIGSFLASNGEGQEGIAYVFHGGPAGPSGSPDWTAEGNQNDARFGDSVNGAFDVNGDGYDDVVVGAPRFDDNDNNEGRIFVYLGSPAGLQNNPAWTADGGEIGAELGTSVAGAGDVNGDGYADILAGAPGIDGVVNNEGRAFLYFGGPNMPSSNPDWTGAVSQSELNFGVPVATAGDVNGDGYADVLVGAALYNGIDNDEGAGFLYLGGPNGPAANADAILTINQANAELGFSAATAGDINADGYSDIILGSPSFDGADANTGGAFVYFGAPVGVKNTPSWFADGDQTGLEFGQIVRPAGDVNGDGYSDYLVGTRYYDGDAADEGRAYLYLGAPGGPSFEPSWTMEGGQFGAAFGIDLGTAGDVNGDGFSDIIIGAPNFDADMPNEGRVYVFHGSPTGPGLVADWVTEGNQAQCFYGRFVSTAGDVNGDGFSDVIVGSPEFDNGENNEGQAFLYLGSETGLANNPIWTFDSNQENAALGRPVTTAGDVNGDGFSDIMVAARRYTNNDFQEGRVYLFFGGTNGPSGSPDWQVYGEQSGAQWGSAIASAGDVNGDGYSDVIVASEFYNTPNNDGGRAAVYHGSATGPSLTPDWIFETQSNNVRTGNAVHTAGDVNNDGYSDVIIGSYLADTELADEGRAYLFYGSSLGLATEPSMTVEGTTAGSELGFSVATAGDVDGNGFADVLVSATGFDDAFLDQGQVLLFAGSGNFGFGPASRQARADDTALIGNLGISELEGSFRIRTNARSAAGRAMVALQVEVKPLLTPFDGTGLIDGPLVDTGAPGGLGSFVELSQLVTGAGAGPLTWRTRLVSRSPFFPGGDWSHLPHNGRTEASLQTLPPIPSVLDLTCTINEADVNLAWIGDADVEQPYTAINVLRDGVIIATLPGTAESYTDFAPGAGLHNYEIVSLVDNFTSSPVTCSASFAPLAIDTLGCMTVAGNVQITWTNPDTYDEFQVLRDGVAIATLPAGTTSYLDMAPPAGLRTYTVIGLLETVAATGVTCQAGVPPTPVIEISCAKVSGRAEFSWTNTEAYTSINVVLSGVVIETLPGNADTYVDLTPPSGAQIYSIIGLVDGVPSISMDCGVELPPTPVADLTCVRSDDNVQLTWTNTESYDELRVFRDGVLIATIPATAVAYLDVTPVAGVRLYEVVPVTDGVISAGATCTVDIPPAPIFALGCAVLAQDVLISWTNGAAYEELQVIRDGVVIASLPPGSVGHIDLALGYGGYTFSVVGLIEGVPSANVTCDVDVVPPAITDLTCLDTGEGDVQIDWLLPLTYDSIVVERAGATIATLAGDANSYLDIFPGGAVHEYNVRGIIGGVSSDDNLCAVLVVPPIRYYFRAQDSIVPYNPGTGVGSFDLSLTIDEGPDNPGFPNAIQGFQMSLSHDTGLLGAATIEPGSAIATMNEGAGPEFFGTEMLATGITIGSVFSFSDASQTLTAITPQEVVVVNYQTNELNLIGDDTGMVTGLNWQDGLGSGLPVPNVVAVDGQSFPATFESANITLMPVAATFVRGDCNTDGLYSVADPIRVLDVFFNAGVVSCFDACDGNDDGFMDIADAVYLLVNLFQAGSNPLAPFPACGTDPTEDVLECDDFMPCF